MIREIQPKSIRWVDVINATPKELETLKGRFGFLPLHLKDFASKGQRPKLDETPGYLFLVLLFPVYDRKAREIVPSEIDFAIGSDYVLTVHDGKLRGLTELFDLIEVNGPQRNDLLNGGPVGLLLRSLERLLAACYPMLDHISLDLKTIEKKIFRGEERRMVSEILISRRNITDFRRIMQAHKNTLKKLITALRLRGRIQKPNQQLSFEQLIDNAKEIWEQLEGHRETVEALYGTNESLISYQLSTVMKNFTTLSVMIFAMTLVATLFAIGVSGTPFLGLRNAFWYIVGLELILAGSLYYTFKHKRWL